MIAMLLTRRIEDGASRLIKGKALVCLEDPRAPPGANLDLPVDLIVKLLFFTGDLAKDTIGFGLGAEELAAKMQHAPLFFKFYGPGRHVRELTRLEISDPAKGPNAPIVQTLDVAALVGIATQQQQQQQSQQRMQNMPPFMKQPFMQNNDYLNSLR